MMLSRWPRCLTTVAVGLLVLALVSPATPAGDEPDRPASDRGEEEDRSEEGEAKPPTEPDPPGFVEQIKVRARVDDLTGIATSGTEGVTGHEDLERRPKLRPGELVETVPGMIATQHSGGGKGNQYFLRGFNLDHGTDFRVSVDGMQVNLPTHGHGQGYTDLNFLIPELIDTARFRKGPYYADVGDFSAAGSVDFDLVRTLPKNRVELVGGSFDYGRALAAGSRPIGDGDLLGAIEYSHYDGPWDRPDHFERFNVVLRYSGGDTDRGFAVTAMTYDGRWDASDQIPKRAVEQGLVGPFGLLDPFLGGESNRSSLSGEWHRCQGSTSTRVNGFLQTYELELLSNFTYYLDDPVEGDQFLQSDERIVLGARVEQRRWADWGRRKLRYGYGGEARFDNIDVGLFSTFEGVPNETFREDDVDQAMGGAFVDAEIRWNDWLRTRAGLRADVYDVDVDGVLDVNSGTESDSLVSPKLSLVLGPWAKTEWYVNLGYGYHSNDARGATIRVDPRTGEPVDRVAPLVRAEGVDVGFRTTALPGLQSSVSFFVLELDSELVFVGDAGGTEASRPSRRTGVEFANFYRPLPWLSIDLDVAVTDAEFTDRDPAGDHIPGAVDEAVAAGISVEHPRGFSGSLRWRYFGPRTLIEDDSVRSGSTSLVNARLGYRLRNGLGFAVEVFNLLDGEESDIAYYYASRLPGEPAEGVEDVHFHPMESRSVRLAMDWRF